MDKLDLDIPILGFAAYSGVGKTTLLIKLLPILKQHGLRVGIIKHAHHDFDIDHPGKDSYELRKAGATQMLVGSRQRFALVVERNAAQEPHLSDFMPHLLQEHLDMVLVEGFKPALIPKIEVHRPGLRKPLLCLQDESFIAVASDERIDALPIPQLDLNDTESIADFVIRTIAQQQSERGLTGA
jgi:molybdopterin-guanine dinucleotide biosynthesis protein B